MKCNAPKAVNGSHSPLTLFFFPPFMTTAIIEHVRDGSVVRALLLPDYYLVTVMLSGIKVNTAHMLCLSDIVNC